MHISQNGINLIKKFEGCKLTAYLCPAGIPTIGYGHTNNVKLGMHITQEQADKFLKEDLKNFEDIVNNLNLDLNPNEFDALTSFCYNCGGTNLKSLVKNRTKPQIADALLLYVKANGKPLVGLVKRRKAERELFLTPISLDNLPYKVKTITNLNIRKAADTTSPIIRTVKKDTILTVWAIETVNDICWGKNGEEYFCLNYCKRI